MVSSADAVAVVLYSNLGDWDSAEIIHPGAESGWTDRKSEYAKVVVASNQAAAMEIIEDHDVENVTVVRPEEVDNGDG